MQSNEKYIQNYFIPDFEGRMSKNTEKKLLSLQAFPEEITEEGVKIYGETSYENQMAVLSQFLHSGQIKGNEINALEKRKEIFFAIRDFLDKKKDIENLPEIDEEFVWHVAESPIEYKLFADFFNVPFPSPTDPCFTFIDLFAGMGGFRLAMQAQGGKCVFSSEWNKYAQKTYFANFGEMPFGDITKQSTKGYIPQDFDILCAGFPCQPFSIAGVSKKKSLGRETGFKDKTQGTLFFDVADIICTHRPKAFYLENVKNLTSHDKGNTFRIIRETLEELNYSIH